MIQAIMPTYLRSQQDVDLTMTAITSFYGTTSDTPLLVVDDGSPFQEGLKEIQNLIGTEGFPGLALYAKPDNEGFSKTVNYGLRRALEQEADALLINADIEFFEKGWLEAMDAREESVVGALLLYPNGVIQHAGIYYSIIGRVFDHRFKLAPPNLAAANIPEICPVTGALQLVRLECLQEVGFYDEEFRLGWEDVDYCHQVFKSGRKCVYEPEARAYHHESMFRGTNPSQQILDWTFESWQYLHVKHAGHDFSEYVPTFLVDDSGQF